MLYRKMFNVPMSLLFCYQVVQTFFSYGGVYSSKYGLYYALYFRYLNYGCVLWGNYYLDPVSQLVKLDEVVRNANNVMTS